MGCLNTKHVDASATGGGPKYKQEDTAPNASEVGNRVETIEKTKTAVFGGLRVRYAYMTQRGWYPDDTTKPNQDAFSVKHDFANEPTDAFFAVYDGHGQDGDLCAQFARQGLPKAIEKHVIRAKEREAKLLQIKTSTTTTAPLELTKEQVQQACLKAHVECNESMHRSRELDDSLSGTTAISVYLHGRRNRMTICNVGDSRAILGQRVRQNKEQDESSSSSSQQKTAATSNLRALPLSRDQTPYRRDERARVRKTGARILSLDQIEGLEPIVEDDEDDDGAGDLVLGEELDEGGDPPRVWSPEGEYPGTAFTRSLGDAIAEELGVFGEPEMLTRELTKDDKIIVLASDGVFEFLTNQSVIDMCAKFNDPLEACRAVVAESYELWVQYELRTDDITMICIFVDGVDMRSGSYASSSSLRHMDSETEGFVDAIEQDDAVDDLVTTESARPVRAHLSKSASKTIQQMKIKMKAEGETDQAIADFDLSALYTEKTPQEKERIAEAIRASVMFQNITEEQREIIFGVMEPISVKKGTWVIKQGTVGDRYYIVDSGRFEVRIVPEGEEDTDGTGGNVVHVYEGSIENKAHPSFGELALMYSAPRAASIIAQTDGHLWALHRYAFRQVLVQQSGRKELTNTLRQMEALRSLSSDDIKKVASLMEEVTFGRGESIITQGEAAKMMYVILSGTCEYLERVDNKTLQSTLKTGDFFGEELLEESSHYRATVVALQTTCCWKLDRSILQRSVGSLQDA